MKKLAAAMPAREGLRGPCGNPNCPKPDHNGGQWGFFDEDLQGEVREGAICSCKRNGCHAYFGMPVYGRKRQASSEAGDNIPTAVAVPAGSRPYCIMELLEVWGVRRAAPASPCLHILQAP